MVCSITTSRHFLSLKTNCYLKGPEIREKSKEIYSSDVMCEWSC